MTPIINILIFIGAGISLLLLVALHWRSTAARTARRSIVMIQDTAAADASAAYDATCVAYDAAKSAYAAYYAAYEIANDAYSAKAAAYDAYEDARVKVQK